MFTLKQRPLLKYAIIEFWRFGLKQANASIFGGFLLFVMIVTQFCYPIESLHRYDFIFLAAIAFQIFLIATKLESLRESAVIIIFHIVATIMELFKTSDAIGSWSYPEEFFFGIGNVPLFTGFMYSAVGSYLARAWRIFEFEYSYFPPKKYTVILVIAIYANFFLHHFTIDLRWILIAASIFLFYKITIYFKVINSHRNMPLIVGLFLVILFIWFAENVATFVNIWKYPHQTDQWQMVSFAKLTSWFLLMQLSFVLVTLIKVIKLRNYNSKAPETQLEVSGC